MQVFLPYSSFFLSAKALDPKRLGSQIKENQQILSALMQARVNDDGQDNFELEYRKMGWENHAVTRMWRGYEAWICLNQSVLHQEWLRRGFNSHKSARKVAWVRELMKDEWSDQQNLPEWFGREDIHRAYQSNLVRKDPEYYRPLFPDVPDDLDYIYPV